MLNFEAQLRRRTDAALGMNCVRVSSSKVCGLLIKSVDEGGVVSAWNAQSTEPEVIRPGDFVVKVNGVDGNHAGVSKLAEALRAAGDIIDLGIWGSRIVDVAPSQSCASVAVQDHIRHLDERSRVCSRREWESLWLLQLPRHSRSASASTNGICTVCTDSI